MRRQNSGTGSRATKTAELERPRRAEPQDGVRGPQMDIQPATAARGRSAHAQLFPDELHTRISKAAYLRAKARGFVPGHELEDWLAAEQSLEE